MHRLAIDDGAAVCLVCGTGWDYTRPRSECTGQPDRSCTLSPEPPSPHFHGTDGHCVWCGEVDRG